MIRDQTVIPFAKLLIEDNQPILIGRVVNLRLIFPLCSSAPFSIIYLINIESLLNAREVLGTGNTRLNKTSFLSSGTYGGAAGRKCKLVNKCRQWIIHTEYSRSDSLGERAHVHTHTHTSTRSTSKLFAHINCALQNANVVTSLLPLTPD